MLSISTSWNSGPETDWSQWLTQVKDLGLDTIELSYTLNHHQLATIEPLLGSMKIKVSSIHNFCPIPNDEPSTHHVSNYYRLSSLDDHERRQAVKWTKICIDTAVRVGAQVVVIHAGTVELMDDPANHLLKLYKEGKKDSSEFQESRKRLLDLRRQKRDPYLKVLEESLGEVTRYAQERNVKIGLETRYYPTEIPNCEEVEYFLNRFTSFGMYYWHDVGHAQINERLGIAPHLEFLQRYKSRMIGVHLHGMHETRDHLAPFDGDLDLNPLLPFFPKDMIRVIESRYASVEQIKAAVDILNSL